jgi:hypothetical protein
VHGRCGLASGRGGGTEQQRRACARVGSSSGRAASLVRRRCLCALRCLALFLAVVLGSFVGDTGLIISGSGLLCGHCQTDDSLCGAGSNMMSWLYRMLLSAFSERIRASVEEAVVLTLQVAPSLQPLPGA